jgi:alpha-glucoside transport system permease protein
MRKGIASPDGDTRITWVGNRRLGRIEIQQQSWTVNWDFTLDNYKQVLLGTDVVITKADGSEEVIPGQDMSQAFLNSLAVAIPSTIIPILIAAFAAYGFAWMNFPGRRVLFILIVGLLVVPLQIALVPILSDYKALGLNGTFLAIWLAHTGFGLALATYLLFNYISTLPRETLESAFIDGASHFTVFTRLILPLSVPALASFAIFQFLWVWNDYLIALVFLGADPNNKVVTQRLADMTGTFGNDWHLLTAGAFVTMLLPLIVFFALQRYFVRGLLAGSVKG